MLPPQLKDIKDRLEAKLASRRTSAENDLIQELKFIDSQLTVTELREAQRDFSVKAIGGPPGFCSCCGRPI